MCAQTKWKYIKDRLDFTQTTRLFFEQYESRYVQVYSILLEKKVGDFYSLVLMEQDTCIGFAYYDGKQTLYISDIRLSTIPDLAKQIALMNWSYTRLAASASVAESFLLLAGHAYSLEMNQFVFSCSKLNLPPEGGGSLVHASSKDFQIAYRMFEGFFVDCWPETPIPKHLSKLLENEMEKNNIFFWKDVEGALVAMAAKVRTTTNTASISWVYTLKEYRGRGFGSKVTAFLTQRLLRQGYRECNLFTDASNPISNHVYIKIGYIEVGQQSVYAVQN